jgi:hypothetical protein
MPAVEGARSSKFPPGYKGEIPLGYFVARSRTFGNGLFFRTFLTFERVAFAIRANVRPSRHGPRRTDFPPTQLFFEGRFFRTPRIL